MKLTSLLQLAERLQQAGKIDNLQQACLLLDSCMKISLLQNNTVCLPVFLNRKDFGNFMNKI